MTLNEMIGKLQAVIAGGVNGDLQVRRNGCGPPVDDIAVLEKEGLIFIHNVRGGDAEMIAARIDWIKGNRPLKPVKATK